MGKNIYGNINVADLSGLMTPSRNLEGLTQPSGMVGDHNRLINRNSSNQHSIGSITGLQEKLENVRSVRVGTTEFWDLHPEFIGEKGDLIVYSDYETIDDQVIPNFKIADGLAYVGALPFVGDDFRYALAEHVNNQAAHVSAEDRSFWDNKVSVKLDPLDLENIIFTTDPL